jgi:uncharacterized membrane protein
MSVLIFILFIFGIPWLILTYRNKIPLSNFFSPIVLCYAFGIILSILNKERNNSYFETASQISQISILIAIPMLLYGSHSIKNLFSYKPVALSFLAATMSSAMSCFAIAFWFRYELDSFALVGAMLSGLYIGGTPNMQAIGIALKGDPNITVQLTAADALVGGSYLVCLTSFIPIIISWILPEYKQANKIIQVPAKSSGIKKERMDLFFILIYTTAWLGVLLGLLYWAKMTENTALILFLITGISISSSFFKFISNKSVTSFKFGEYLLMVFALSLSFQGKWSEILTGSNVIIIVTALSMYGSILLHLIIGKIMRIDRDTFLITSTAAIYGPPFVTQVASVLKNKDLLMPGIMAGLTGYAIGNYIGLAVYYMLVYCQSFLIS